MPTLIGDNSGNLLEGSSGNDVLLGNGGDDTLAGGLGNDSLQGGSGIDIATFSERYSDYFLEIAGLSVTLNGPEGIDVVFSSVEQLRFSDATVQLRWQTSVSRTSTDVQVNTDTVDSQYSSAVAALADGGFVAAWTSSAGNDLDIRAQRFSDRGLPSGSEFLVNATDTENQENQEEVSLSSFSNGGFLAVWTSAQNGAAGDVYGRIFTAEGVASGNEFQVNATIDGGQYDSAVAVLADDSFIVTWTSDSDNDSLRDVFAQRFSVDGARLGIEFRVNSSTAREQDASAVTALADGGFVVTWTSLHENTHGGIFAQLYAADGSMVGTEFRVNTFAAERPEDPEESPFGIAGSAIAGLADGGFVITWTSLNQDGDSQGVFGQRYSSSGQKLGGEFLVNKNFRNAQSGSSIAGLSDGGFVVTWTSLGQDGNLTGIFGQRYAADGTPVGAEFRVNAYTSGVQFRSAVTALPDGEFVITWDSFAQDGDNFGVFARKLPSIAGVSVVGDPSDQTLTGTAGNDTVQGGAGRDNIDGRNGIDTVVYREKTATEGVTLKLKGAVWVQVKVDGILEDEIRNIENVVGGGGSDVISGDARPNRLLGSGGNDKLLGNGGRDVLVGGVGRDVLDGGAGPDILRGNGGRDVLRGKAGRDVMDGGAGVDTASFAEKKATQAVSVTLSGKTLATVSVQGVAEDRLRNVENLVGGAGADTFIGDSKPNQLKGSGGNDVLVGRGGNDFLSGGKGSDSIRGGAGADRFVFDTALNANSNVDTITDFQPGTDKLVLDDDIFTRFTGTLTGAALSPGNFVLGTVALDADDYLVYDPTTGALLYDGDGNAGGAAVRFATLIVVGSAVPGAEDFLVVA